jgi:zinc/manganese transport system permease protein
METWEIIKWPLLACLALPWLLVYLGLHIVRRGIIFVDLALAQVAAFGTCVCLALGHEPGDIHAYYYAVGFTLLGALIFSLTRPREPHRVPQEALIGIVYVVAAAASILVLSKSAAGNEELKKILIGEILTVSWAQIWKTFVLFLLIAIVHYIFRRRFMALSFHHGESSASGLAERLWDFLFYALFGLVVTSFVQIGGVLLVFSYLVIPAVCANLLAQRFSFLLIIGWLFAVAGSIGGIWGSTQFDVPTGAAIVCALGGVLILVGLLAKAAKMFRSSRRNAPTSSIQQTPG